MAKENEEKPLTKAERDKRNEDAFNWGEGDLKIWDKDGNPLTPNTPRKKPSPSSEKRE